MHREKMVIGMMDRNISRTTMALLRLVRPMDLLCH